MSDPEEFEALDAAILRLQERDARAGDVVRLRFFAGLSIDEVAQALNISSRSAKRDWEYSRAWLLRELKGGGSEGA
jgi:DNA-directed RNA polymerase specialized sigma24 family protein